MTNFCPMPFNSLEISPDGTCKVCCKIESDIYKEDGTAYNVLTDNLEDIWNSKNLQLLRDKFNNDQRPEECRLCWTEEASNVKSLRLQNFNYEFNKENPQIRYLSLKLSNKCNLACRICSPHLSSLWQSQFSKLGLPLNPVKMFKTIDLEKFQGDRLESLYNISSGLRFLLIYGGEPLVNDEIINYLKYLVSSGVSKNIRLVLNTNGTVYSEELINIFYNFKFVDLFLSIDDIEKRFEYQRWPAKWAKVNSNIQKYSRLSGNIEVGLYPSVSILNILNIEETLIKLSSYGIPITFNNIIHSPQILSIRNFPKEIKQEIISQLETIDFSNFFFQKEYPDAKNALISFIKLDNDPGFDLDIQSYLNKINSHMDIHDEFRGTHLKDYIPDLWNLLNGN